MLSDPDRSAVKSHYVTPIIVFSMYAGCAGSCGASAGDGIGAMIGGPISAIMSAILAGLVGGLLASILDLNDAEEHLRALMAASIVAAVAATFWAVFSIL